MSKLRIGACLSALFIAFPSTAEQRIVSMRTDKPPIVDGNDNDAAWELAAPITTRDALAGIDVSIRSLHTNDEIYFLIRFPDSEENRSHKVLHWDSVQQRYRIGPEREDTFVLKWSMEAQPVDLSLSSDTPYTADIWYWKSHRTDHAGYADDKLHLYSAVASKRTKKLLSKNGNRFFLSRRGDEGSAAYKATIKDAFVSDQMQNYEQQTPTASRADIRAKGLWKEGMWTLEIRRKLDTGHSDDVQFDPARSYHFGVSRYEIAGRKTDPTNQQPLFGSGEVGEDLILIFGRSS